MPRHRGRLARRPVHVNGVVRALPQQLAVIGFDMANEVTPPSSGRDLKAFADDGTGAEGPVGLEHQAHGFVEVGSGFLERRPLGVSTRKLFYEGDVAFRHLLEHGGQLEGHGA